MTLSVNQEYFLSPPLFQIATDFDTDTQFNKVCWTLMREVWRNCCLHYTVLNKRCFFNISNSSFLTWVDISSKDESIRYIIRHFFKTYVKPCHTSFYISVQIKGIHFFFFQTFIIRINRNFTNTTAASVIARCRFRSLLPVNEKRRNICTCFSTLFQRGAFSFRYFKFSVLFVVQAFHRRFD